MKLGRLFGHAWEELNGQTCSRFNTKNALRGGFCFFVFVWSFDYAQQIPQRDCSQSVVHLQQRPAFSSVMASWLSRQEPEADASKDSEEREVNITQSCNGRLDAKSKVVRKSARCEKPYTRGCPKSGCGGEEKHVPIFQKDNLVTWQDQSWFLRALESNATAWDDQSAEGRAPFSSSPEASIRGLSAASLVPSPAHEPQAQPSVPLVPRPPRSPSQLWSQVESLLCPNSHPDTTIKCSIPAPTSKGCQAKERFEVQAVKLADKNRKGRERSLRTRIRNAGKVRHLQQNIQHLERENIRLRSNLEITLTEFEQHILAGLPSCVQEFEMKLSEKESPGLRNCLDFISNLEGVARNSRHLSTPLNLRPEGFASDVAVDRVAMQSMGNTNNTFYMSYYGEIENNSGIPWLSSEDLQ